MKITAEELRDTLNYDPLTGHLTWQKSTRNYTAGKRAGSLTSHGYVSIMIGGRNYGAHRLIWLLMTGEWPAKQIDHINRVRDDNRWENLRLASNAENGRNAVRKSGRWPVGVMQQKSGNFQAKIMRDYKYICLGTYETPELAHDAYRTAAREHHGEFARKF